MLLNIVLLFAGSIASATSVIMIKASEIPPGYLGALRLAFAVVLFFIPAVRGFKKFYGETESGFKTHLFGIIRAGLLPGLFLGLHFITWNTGARLTLAANASLIVNMIPLVMPVFVFLLYRISLVPLEALGSAIAVAGIVFLSIGSVRIDPAFLKGDLICLVSMLFLAAYLVLAKRTTGIPLFPYIVVVYAAGSITCFVGGLITEGPFLASYISPPELWYAVGLALIPTMLGHTFVNYAMRTLPSQIVSIAQLTQFIWATIFALVLFGEVPAPVFIPASLAILAGGALGIRAHWPRRTVS